MCVLNSEVIGKVWTLAVSRLNPPSALTVKFRWLLHCLYQEPKTRPEPNCPNVIPAALSNLDGETVLTKML